MTKKGAKATRKFAKSGELKRIIDNRRKHQSLKKKVQARKASRGAALTRDAGSAVVAEGEINEERETKGKRKGQGRAKAVDFLEDEVEDPDHKDEKIVSKGKFSGMSVDELLSGRFIDDDDDADGDEESFNDDDDFSDVDDIQDDEDTHKMELAALAEKDPAFYKYLQENDKELLNFTMPTRDDPEVMSQDGGFALDGSDNGSEVDEGEKKVPILTAEILKTWQKAILETRSLGALRKLLIAFRSAARMNEDDDRGTRGGWRIEEATVFNKLVATTFRYTPVVLEHHIPYKVLPDGKFKAPTQTNKFKALQKLILSYFLNVIHFVSELSDAQMKRLAVSESARLIPYVVSSRKAIRAYLKMCFELWSSAEDEVRLSALLAMRMVIGAQDASIVDLVLRGTYTALVRSCKASTSHTIPSINLMKNSAAELYCVDPSVAYQHAFGFVRQLAVHLRNSMKVKSKEAYKQVYNWQFVHSIDFWGIVLGRACNAEAEFEGGEESELKPLIYPLIQVTIGAIKLIPTGRYYPLHLQLNRTLLHLTQHTHTYVSLAPFLVPIISSSISASPKSKQSLRPLDVTLHIRAPAQYLKTRVYTESICEEALFLFGSWAECVQGSIAFPEIILPSIIVLKKSLKKSLNTGKHRASSKIVGMVKVLLERIEEGVKWVSVRRDNIAFAPANQPEVEKWERGLKIEDTPIGKYMRVQRKTREKKQVLLNKARDGNNEIIEED